MKSILLTTFCLLVAIASYAQKKECKFEKQKDSQTGKMMETISAPTGLGKFTLIKREGSVYLFYQPRNLLTASHSGQDIIDIDSLTFIFSDDSRLTFEVRGAGWVSNTPSVKPQYTNLMFGEVLKPEQLRILQEKLVLAFQVKGEKDAEGTDALDEKQRVRFQQVLDCIE